MSEAARPDVEELRRFQREAWSAAAPGWDRWFDTFESFAAPVSAELVRAVQVTPGQSVLDVGCGTGEPSLTVARVVGPSGRVLGVDLAAPMIERARRRALDAGLSQAEFRAGEAEDVRGDGPFDAAVSRFALMLVPDPVRTAAAVRAALRPGAPFAAAVWGEASEVPFCALVPAVAQKSFRIPPPPPDAPGPTRLGAPDALAAVLRAGGFTDVVETTMRIEARFTSVEDSMRFYADVSGYLRRLLDEHTPAARQEFEHDLVRELEKHRASDGSVRLPSAVRVARGTAPAIFQPDSP